MSVNLLGAARWYRRLGLTAIELPYGQKWRTGWKEYETRQPTDYELEIWQEAKALGVTTGIAYVDGEVGLADTDTFERHKVSVPWFSQVGLPRRYWQRRPRSAPALQMGLWPEKAVA